MPHPKPLRIPHEEIEVRIADLVPSEPSVIGPSVEEKRQAYREGKPMHAAVVRVDGDGVDGGLLVIDGHHTIRALLEEGQDSIKCRVRHDTDQQQVQRRRDIYVRRKQEGLTFASLPVDASESERKERIEAEDDAEFMEQLLRHAGDEGLAVGTTDDDEIKFE